MLIENKCYSGIYENYYLNTTSNIIHNNRLVNLVYKPCYWTCKKCIGDGDLFNHTFGLLSSNGINCSQIKISSNEDFIEILSQNIKYIHEQIDNLNLNIQNEPFLIIKKEEFMGYIIKNLNLI